MNETVAQLKYRITGLERKLFSLTANSYTGRGDVLHFAEDLEPAAVRDLADMIAEVCGGTASVFSGTDGEGYSFCLVTRSGDLRQLCKDMTRALNGRGGGKPIFQQGKVMATREQIEQFFGA
jgi:alanyl-tRNA synthetase